MKHLDGGHQSYELVLYCRAYSRTVVAHHCFTQKCANPVGVRRLVEVRRRDRNSFSKWFTGADKTRNYSLLLEVRFLALSVHISV